jgi:hypothetical protein
MREGQRRALNAKQRALNMPFNEREGMAGDFLWHTKLVIGVVRLCV